VSHQPLVINAARSAAGLEQLRINPFVKLRATIGKSKRVGIAMILRN
jgi:hypothetical protein